MRIAQTRMVYNVASIPRYEENMYTDGKNTKAHTCLHLSIIQFHWALHSMANYLVPYSHILQTNYLTRSILTPSLSWEFSSFFLLFLVVVVILRRCQYLASNGRMTAELEWPAQIAVLSRNLSRGADANHAGPHTRVAGAPAKISTAVPAVTQVIKIWS